MQRTTFLLLLWHVFLQNVHSEYVMQLHLIEFRNPSKKMQDGNCCNYSCAYCNPMFKVCVSVLQQNEGVSDCNVGKFKTKEYIKANDVIFGPNIGQNIPNPVSMKGNAWKSYNGLRFIVRKKSIFGRV